MLGRVLMIFFLLIEREKKFPFGLHLMFGSLHHPESCQGAWGFQFLLLQPQGLLVEMCKMGQQERGLNPEHEYPRMVA